MAWPTIDEAVAWVGNIGADDVPVLERCLAASVGFIEDRVTLDLVDATDPTSDVIVPDTVALAALITAARLFRRRQSPEGVAAFGTEVAVYVSRLDVDVQALISSHRHLGFA